MNTVTFTQMGFPDTVTACSATPSVDGYTTTFGGYPYHIHSEATPGPWAALETAITSGEVTVVAYVAPVISPPDLHAYANSKANSLLSAMRTYGPLKADASAGTIADLMALAQWGAANPALTGNWIANDSSIQAVTGAQFVANAPLVGAYRMLIYGTELAGVLASIADGTITTIAQVDAYAWTE